MKTRPSRHLRSSVYPGSPKTPPPPTPPHLSSVRGKEAIQREPRCRNISAEMTCHDSAIALELWLAQSPFELIDTTASYQ
jgi:hypothetical protein